MKASKLFIAITLFSISVKAQTNRDGSTGTINHTHTLGIDTTRSDYNSIHSGNYNPSRNVMHDNAGPLPGYDSIRNNSNNTNSNSGTINNSNKRNGTRIDIPPQNPNTINNTNNNAGTTNDQNNGVRQDTSRNKFNNTTTQSHITTGTSNTSAHSKALSIESKSDSTHADYKNSKAGTQSVNTNNNKSKTSSRNNSRNVVSPSTTKVTIK